MFESLFNIKKGTRTSELVETVLGKDVTCKGSIGSASPIWVEGTFEGEINCQSEVIIGEGAVIKAQVNAGSMTIGGQVFGNIDVMGTLELLPTAKLIGDIKVGKLAIADGAVFNGSCEMKG